MTPFRPMRIGDAERETAATALAEHYAAGRLTRQEYEDRLDSVWGATFDVDLRTIFADLPEPSGCPARTASTGARGAAPEWRGRPAGFAWIMPLMLVGLFLFVGLGVWGGSLLLVVGVLVPILAGACGQGRGRIQP